MRNPRSIGMSTGGTNAMITSIVQYAITTPAMPATIASRNDSVSSWRISRVRLAPSDRRTATSRRRDTAFDNSRFATFAHAITSTSATSIDSTPSIGASTVPAPNGASHVCTMRRRRPSLKSRYSCSSCAMIDDASACACSCETPGFKPDDRLEPAVAALVHAIAAHHFLLHRHRHPRRRRHAEERADESLRRDADDRDRRVVDRDLLADHRGIAGEAALPVGVAEHRDRMAARRDVVLGGEEAARGRTNAHHLEVVAADERAPRALGGVVDGDAEGLIVLRDDVQHRRAIAEVDEVGIGPRAALPFAVLHRGDANRRGIRRQRDGPEQHRLDPREDRRVGADAETERQDRGQRQARDSSAATGRNSECRRSVWTRVPLTAVRRASAQLNSSSTNAPALSQ